MKTPDTEGKKEVESFKKIWEHAMHRDTSSFTKASINFKVEELLSSRDTYWKERVEAVEAVLMEQYKNALRNEDGEANGYAHSLAIVKDLHREFIHEDNLK